MEAERKRGEEEEDQAWAAEAKRKAAQEAKRRRQEEAQEQAREQAMQWALQKEEEEAGNQQTQTDACPGDSQRRQAPRPAALCDA